METIIKPIIIPWDFTPVGENALAYAKLIAGILNREIIVLHLVEKDEDVLPATEKLDAKIEELQKDIKQKLHSLVKVGNIFDTIREVAHEFKAEVVIMGTHGRKGMQKVTGSWALKVMANSKVPFLIVQDKPGTEVFKKIVFPIDFRKENKEKVASVSYLSKHYNSKFLLFKRKSADRTFKRRLASNLLYAENVLKNNSVEYEIHTAQGKKSFEKELIDFTKQQEADMILILVTRDIGFLDYMIAAREQYIIANPERIPVYCMNPKPAKIASGFRALGG
ncbi:MAG: universal stress protein [Bacteroidales bacterium]|nr:universal stress protein [Bacteroidales bacterium]MCF8389552.1 universal stress protein [Bacteroidales bacterium]